jgi:hypothetical protein
MCCVVEILSIVLGIMTLVRGRFSLGKDKEVRGAPAYLIGVVLLAIIPVGVVAFIILNFDDLMKGGGPQGFQMNAKAVLPDVIGVVLCWGTVLIIFFAKAKPKVDERRRVTGEYDDYDDDLPGRRRDHDDDDDRPRRRPRDPYDYDDDRPRRRGDDLDDRAR